jgi:hypothetical protein
MVKLRTKLYTVNKCSQKGYHGRGIDCFRYKHIEVFKFV